MVNKESKYIPVAPPLPCLPASKLAALANGSSRRGYSWVSTETRDLWNRLFDEGHKADVYIHTENGDVIYAHSIILSRYRLTHLFLESHGLDIHHLTENVENLIIKCREHFEEGMSSPVLKGMLKHAKRHKRKRSISIRGVPSNAVRIFVRFLYSSCYDREEFENHLVHLLALSHVYVVPQLKQLCIQKFETSMLTIENVVDMFQFSLLCDAPRLSLVCHRMLIKNFKAVSETDGWKVMKQSHPVLEKELLQSIIGEENRRKEMIRKNKERVLYLQLYDAMEALVHICRDGCQTIGPNDKDFEANKEPCRYESCKGLELLIRHFASCKLRVPGGCIHCKRMWQLLELHSRLCDDSNHCKVPLCSNFKDRIQKQSKKDELTWRRLVKEVLRAKGIKVAPIFSSAQCQ